MEFTGYYWSTRQYDPLQLRDHDGVCYNISTSERYLVNVIIPSIYSRGACAVAMPVADIAGIVPANCTDKHQGGCNPEGSIPAQQVLKTGGLQPRVTHLTMNAWKFATWKPQTAYRSAESVVFSKKSGRAQPITESSILSSTSCKNYFFWEVLQVAVSIGSHLIMDSSLTIVSTLKCFLYRRRLRMPGGLLFSSGPPPGSVELRNPPKSLCAALYACTAGRYDIANKGRTAKCVSWIPCVKTSLPGGTS